MISIRKLRDEDGIEAATRMLHVKRNSDNTEIALTVKYPNASYGVALSREDARILSHALLVMMDGLEEGS